MKSVGKKVFAFFVFAGIIVFTIFSAAFEYTNSDKARYVFIFESLDKKQLIYESRFLPKISEMRNERIFCDELLLGSLFHDAKKIFPDGTSIKSLFVRDNMLYVDFSPEILTNANADADFAAMMALFETNIKTNFRHVDKINVFLDGQQLKL